MKLQKIMLDAGFSCPNRDGSVGVGGCTFCRTESFNPAYCKGTITQQLEAGKLFFAGKYPDMKYLAYFQAYSNTYAPLSVLKQRYEEALSVADVVGLVVGTRPDCISTEALSYLASIQERGFSVSIEIGVESLYDRTLHLINRGHTSATTIEAITRCADAGLQVGAHLIIGLPGESSSDILDEADILNSLPISYIKLHQLQILQGTPMASLWQQQPDLFLAPSLNEYVLLTAQFATQLRPDIRIERFASSSPSHLLIAPRWGVKPNEVETMIRNKISELRI